MLGCGDSGGRVQASTVWGCGGYYQKVEKTNDSLYLALSSFLSLSPGLQPWGTVTPHAGGTLPFSGKPSFLGMSPELCLFR